MTSQEKNITEKLNKAESREEINLNEERDCATLDDFKTPFGRLDGHILFEILVRLPVKTLLQVKRVCKHWRYVVRDPYFVGLHYTRSKACPKFLIYVDKKERYLFSVDLLKGGVLLGQMKLEIQSEDYQRVKILNPVNGLVCFATDKGKVIIHNPSTGDKTSWIESTLRKQYYRTYYGFGFDSKTREHKVVCLSQYNNTGYKISANDVCEVLTVGQNTWRKIDLPPYKVYGESVHVNGVVYWLSTYQQFDLASTVEAKYIVAFDIGREKFRVIDIPADCRRSSASYGSNNRHDLLVIDGCLGLLNRTYIVDGDGKHTIKMWIFHDDHKATSDTSSSWTEETIPIPPKWGTKTEYGKWSRLFFQAITDTNLIIIKRDHCVPQGGSFGMYHGDEQPGGVFPLYCYDRKKKTLDFVEISTVSNGKGFLINEQHVYGYGCGTFVESLYPVH